MTAGQVRQEEARQAASEEQSRQREELSAEFAAVRSELEAALQGAQEDGQRLLGEKEAAVAEAGERLDQLRAQERKAAPLLKDLKRQVASEKKRGDRLQEKCQELLSEVNRLSPGFEVVRKKDCLEVEGGGSGGRGHNGDSGSTVSGEWVLPRGQTPAEEAGSTCSTGDIEVENQELIARLTSLQSENFQLREQVGMLEESGAGMAQQIVSKTDIIRHYVRDRAPSASSLEAEAASKSLKRLLDGLKVRLSLRTGDGGDDHCDISLQIDLSAPDIRETNRALQVMLEESLTKNIQLQNVAFLSFVVTAQSLSNSTISGHGPTFTRSCATLGAQVIHDSHNLFLSVSHSHS